MKRPFVAPALSFVAGTLLAHWTGRSNLPIWLAGSFAWISAPIVFRRVGARCLILHVVFALAGFWAYQCRVAFPPRNRADQAIGPDRHVVLSGTVREIIVLGGRTGLVMDSIKMRDETGTMRSWTGRVLASLHGISGAPVQEHDRVRLDAPIAELPFSRIKDGSGYTRWLCSKGVVLTVNVTQPRMIRRLDRERTRLPARLIRFLKETCLDNLSKGLPKESREGAMMKALVAGHREDVTWRVKAPLIYTNTVHILSVSGLHLGLLMGAVLAACRTLAMRPAHSSFVAIACIWLYAGMTGLRASVVRAGIMATIYMAGRMALRRPDGANSLALSAIFMLSFNPLLIFDPGFQLSYACMMSLFFLAPPMVRIFSPQDEGQHPSRRWGRIGRVLGRVSGASAGVWIGILPLVAFHAELVSPVTLIANLLAIPLTGLVMNLGFVSAIFGSLDFFAGVLNPACAMLLKAFLEIMNRLADVPGAFFFVIKPSILWCGGFYALVACASQSRLPGMLRVACVAGAIAWISVLIPQQDKGSWTLKVVQQDGATAALVQEPGRAGRIFVLMSPGVPGREDDRLVHAKHVLKARTTTEVRTFQHDEDLESACREFAHGDIRVSCYGPGAVLEPPPDIQTPAARDIFIFFGQAPERKQYWRLINTHPACCVIFGDMVAARRLVRQTQERGISAFTLNSGSVLSLESDGRGIWVKTGG